MSDEDSGVEVDGSPVAPEPREVWAVNKPAGVVSTASEPGSRRAVTELVDSERRLYPVGRLDADSTGLILLTNDGELANRLTHPRYGVPKTYRVELARPPSDRDLRAAARRRARSTTGRPLPPRSSDAASARSRSRSARAVSARCAGWPRPSATRSEALTRIRIGSLGLGGLRRGDARPLEQGEVDALWEDSAP